MPTAVGYTLISHSDILQCILRIECKTHIYALTLNGCNDQKSSAQKYQFNLFKNDNILKVKFLSRFKMLLFVQTSMQTIDWGWNLKTLETEKYCFFVIHLFACETARGLIFYPKHPVINSTFTPIDSTQKCNISP